MDLLELLKKEKFDLINILKTYNLTELHTKMDEIVSSPEGYNELKDSENTNNNFFTLLSHIYLIEQNRLQNAVNADKQPTSRVPFDKKFTSKVDTLAKAHEYPQKLSK